MRRRRKNAQNLQVSVSKWISNKEQITRRKLKKNRKYFNPFVCGPGWFERGKKGGRKSRWTVPLRPFTYVIRD